MSDQHTLRLMARYNQWMNNRLLEKSATLSEVVLREDKGAFFGSIFGTLNHMMVGDTVWLKRFALHPKNYSALRTMTGYATPDSLDATLYDTLPALSHARQSYDQTIIAWMAQVDDADFAESFEYSNMSGKKFTDPFAHVVQHFFNHQTHHRGQITTLFSQIGVDIGATDLIAMMRE